ncbi:MAG: ATP-binding protein, partial [Ignavibacteriaceae bacterium]
FTEKGSVEVKLYTNKKGKVCAEVKDTGIGISEEYMPNLFKSFSQESKGYSRKFEGNGLGLALTKKYTDLNKAEITVKSKKGEGSTFTVSFME